MRSAAEKTRKIFRMLPFSVQTFMRRYVFRWLWAERLEIEEDLDHHHFTDSVALAHIARYKWVLPFLTGKYCLDDGCGTGYGTNYLSKHGIRIVGLDNSRRAIKHARQRFRADNLEFAWANALHTDFPDDCFDAVLSFEVIEHLSPQDQRTYLREARRILRKEGQLYIGTPNRNANPLTGFNPYHKKELSFSEFQTMLEDYFTIKQHHTQAFIIDGTFIEKDLQEQFKSADIALSEDNILITRDMSRLGFELLAICQKDPTTHP